PQGNLTSVLTGSQFEFELTIADVFASSKKTPITKVIQPAVAKNKDITNLFICPSDISLSRVIEQSLAKVHREKILTNQLALIEADFDLVLLDCPPNLSLTSVNAMMASSLFIIPVDGGSFSLNGLSDLLDALEEVKETDDVNFLVFRNEYAKSNKLINNFLDEQLTAFPDNLLKSTVAKTEVVGQASVSALPVMYYKSGAVVNNDYKRLAKEIFSHLEV
ncbi:MAG: ParA family protein, partial [Alteromonadales bacterium]|nr:ParA family protein [Alteromonadales bacterium]